MGTPAYMAPEYIDGRNVSEKNDIFAAGLILYEMVVGHKAVQGSNIYQIMHRIASEPIELPPTARYPSRKSSATSSSRHWKKNPSTVMPAPRKCTMRCTPTCWPMKTPIAFSGIETKHAGFPAAADAPQRRFPALSESVSSINRVVSSDKESINKLSNSILKDFALTNKILRLVNTAFYSTYGGGTISTISRAVIILGFDAVRNIAVTLILFEHCRTRLMRRI